LQVYACNWKRRWLITKGTVVGLGQMEPTIVGDVVFSSRELLVYVSWGRCWEDGVNGVMTYKGGNNIVYGLWIM